MQVCIEGEVIRGGTLDQTQYMMDGLLIVDNRTNQPVRVVNLSAIKEISIVKGGFNAEYGNLRSGLINIITKEGDAARYSGSIDLRISPAHVKHSGPSIFSPNNWLMRPYLDPQVAYVGTKAGWDPNTQLQYKSFIGWDAVANRVNTDNNPDNDMTADQARSLFIWQHRLEGSDSLGRAAGQDGTRPDYFVDGSFSGPIPIIGKKLGNASFFVSHNNTWDAFTFPTSRDYYNQSSSMLKITSRLTNNMKLILDGIWGQTLTVAKNACGPSTNPLLGPVTTATYVTSGADIVNNTNQYATDPFSGLYFPGFFTPFSIYNKVLGFSFDHVLSPKTFYTIRASYVNSRMLCTGGQRIRSLDTVRYFGKQAVNESPYGVWRDSALSGWPSIEDGMTDRGGDGQRENSYENSYSMKFDLTSQLYRMNQFKVGFQINHDKMHTYQELNRWGTPIGYTQIEWDAKPWRFGAYLQDKIEYEGLLANVGFRLDYNYPNVDWPITDDHYSRYFRAKYEDQLLTALKLEPAKGHLVVQPRVGIAHPLSENAKLYFNYGHFISMPPARDLYNIDWGRNMDGVTMVGNPNVLWARTVAYELGAEYNLGNMFLVHVSGYYKDVSDQTNPVRYTSYDRLVNYETFASNNYQDIRGFELQIEKNYGMWISGFLNYNYQVVSSGYFGRYNYFENQLEQALYGLQNPVIIVPLPQPYARALVAVNSPDDFGPEIAGIRPLADISVNSLFWYKSGHYETWDPLNTRVLKANLHWKSSYNLDMRFSKKLRVAGFNMELFCDIQNLWKSKEGDWDKNRNRFNRAFQDADDRRYYLESLHLPMYKDPSYSGVYVGGDDVPGMLRPEGVAFDPWVTEIPNPTNDPTIEANNKTIRADNERREKNKAYIDNPNREFLMDLIPTSVWLGVKIDF
jgi:hypothetical protein